MSESQTPTVARERGAVSLLKRAFKRYFIDAMGAMAYGLFASLLIGIILKQLFSLIDWAPLQQFSELISAQVGATSPVVGAAIGVAIAYGLREKPLVIYSAVAVGAIGYAVSVDGVSAGPVGAFVAVVVGAELGQLVAGRTRLDIILIPTVTIVSGTLVAIFVGPAVAGFMRSLGEMVNVMTQLRPFWMGIAVSAVMSIILFLPTSSAALSIMLGLSGLAAGAATAGCAASMVGFAVASYRENGVGGLLSQGLGTSMLHIGNTMRHPIILVPATVAAIVGGPISTLLFKMENIAYGAGMGTSGLVGPLTTFATMAPNANPAVLLIKIVLLHVVIPGAIALAVSEFMRRRGWIEAGWMKLEV